MRAQMTSMSVPETYTAQMGRVPSPPSYAPLLQAEADEMLAATLTGKFNHFISLLSNIPSLPCPLPPQTHALSI
jgi:hypothetical protein